MKTADEATTSKHGPGLRGVFLDAQLLDLRAFILVVDCGSITAAAKTIGETKSSVSRRLARLERAVGIGLLQRGPRSARPTDEGVVFRQRVGEALKVLDEAADAANPSAALAGTVRVTAPADFALFLAPLLAEFGERYPGIHVDLVLSTRRLDLEKERIDVAFRIATALGDSSLITRRIMELDLGLFASPEYVRSHPGVQAPEDLRLHRTLTFRVPAGAVVQLVRRDAPQLVSRIPIVPSFAASDGNVLRELAIAGAGIAILPTLFVDEALRAGRLVRLLEEYRVPVKLFVNMLAAHRVTPSRVRAFLDFFAEALVQRKAHPKAPTARTAPHGSP